MHVAFISQRQNLKLTRNEFPEASHFPAMASPTPFTSSSPMESFQILTLTIHGGNKEKCRIFVTNLLLMNNNNKQLNEYHMGISEIHSQQ